MRAFLAAVALVAAATGAIVLPLRDLARRRVRLEAASLVEKLAWERDYQANGEENSRRRIAQELVRLAEIERQPDESRQHAAVLRMHRKWLARDTDMAALHARWAAYYARELAHYERAVREGWTSLPPRPPRSAAELHALRREWAEIQRKYRARKFISIQKGISNIFLELPDPEE